MTRARPAIWAALAAAYWAVIAGIPGSADQTVRLDPMTPQGRAVERAIMDGRFEDARPLAADLARQFPADPLAAYWQATIFHGLRRPSDEAAAWERFMTLSSEALAACPQIVVAYDQAGSPAQSRQARERCQKLETRPGRARAADSHD
jgi:hypothetical protein